MALMTMKQPHQDVAGVQREDDLLSLDDTAVAHRDALIGMAYYLRRATLVGNRAPVVEDIHQRITLPRIGDLVVEVSAPHRRDVETRIKSLGILVEHRTEWLDTDEEWARIRAEDSSAGARSTDEAWYVQYGPNPGDICRWTNCSFLALPTLAERFEEWTA